MFQFEIVSISVAATDETAAPFDEKPKSQTSQFWLCGDCAANMTLVLEPVNGLKLLPVGAETADLPKVPLSGSNIGKANNC